MVRGTIIDRNVRVITTTAQMIRRPRWLKSERNRGNTGGQWSPLHDRHRPSTPSSSVDFIGFRIRPPAHTRLLRRSTAVHRRSGIIGVPRCLTSLTKMKKIAIFGGTGMTGLCTVEAALKQGKRVPERFPFSSQQLRHDIGSSIPSRFSQA